MAGGVRIAVAGAGLIGRRHIEEIDASRLAQLAGIVDPLPVALAVLEKSTSAAIMAMTTDVLIRHKKPDMAKAP